MPNTHHADLHYDYIVIGSGFGGSVSALRLSQKGYKVLVLEQGREFKSDQFPKSNWNLRKWLWVPFLRFYGFFRIKVFRHVTVLAGAGVGGGSLVYGNTLPIPRKEFYQTGKWAKLHDWEKELAPFYEQAADMLGTCQNPNLGPADQALKKLAEQIGKSKWYEPTRVAVFFGEPEIEVDDPYFDGEGPRREGCRSCGGCMVGCRYNAKNSLDKNYLYLAQKKGATIQARTKAVSVEPLNTSRNEAEIPIHQGYKLETVRVGAWFRRRKTYTAKNVVLAGGVLGTIPLLLKMKKKQLPKLSTTLGHGVRTNNEALIGVISRHREINYAEGVAIGSIVHTDQHSHLEPVRYSRGSGFWRLLMAPMMSAPSFGKRLFLLFWDFIRHPIQNAHAYFVKDWASKASILLFMQTLDSQLRISKGLAGYKTGLESGTPPSAFLPEAQDLARKYAKIVNGKPLVLPTESLFGIPTTAHILGGACIGQDDQEGVIDDSHQIFHYPGLYVIDGAAVSANPGVNPSLTIAALAERAMSMIPQQENSSK